MHGIDLGWFTSNRVWMLVGFGGQGLFTSRFLVQWLRSEIEGRSVLPVAFWYFSLGGGMVTLAYTVHLQSAPLALGQVFGLAVYSRNLYLAGRQCTAVPSPTDEKIA